MKNLSSIKLNRTHQRFSGIFVVLFAFGMFLASCQDDNNVNPNASYQQVNLVASSSGYNAAKVDANLVNPWGVAVGPTGAFWISSTGSNNTMIYDRTGLSLLAPISISGKPTGVVYNSSNDFVIPSTALVSKFIYVGEEGSVHSWSTGTTAVEVVDHSASGAVYKGVDIGTDGDANYIYIANFSQGKIEVLDKNFNVITTKPFVDPNLPVGFAPFNVKNIDGKLYVTYAKQSTDKHDDVSGSGNGFVSIFNTDGTFVKRFASQGTLNSPWGIAEAPNAFEQGSNAILVGNFGDGRINVYTKDGNYKGQLKDGDAPISIPGLWSLTFPSNGNPVGDQNQLFFTAGPDNENDGLFGYIKLR
jgi:uncharacterized protein (TIGR03118 family)